MAHIVVIGSVARDDIVNMTGPMRAGTHMNGRMAGIRLGGGGANTAVALAAAGHHVTLMSAVGQDAIGDALIGELEQAGVDTTHVLRIACESTHSLVLVDPKGERSIVNVARCDEQELPTRLLSLSADAVYVRSRRADLGPLLARKAADTLTVAHVPPLDAGSRPAQVIVTSAADLEQREAEAPMALARSVAGERLQWVIVTAGAAGARATSQDEAFDAPAQTVPVVDTTGAGDAFAAGLLHALVSGTTMREALAMAVRFGTEATLWPRSGLPAEAVHRLLEE